MPDGAAFPFENERSDFYLQLSGGLQPIRLAVEIRTEADTAVYRTKPEDMSFASVHRLAVVERIVPVSARVA